MTDIFLSIILTIAVGWILVASNPTLTAMVKHATFNRPLQPTPSLLKDKSELL